MIPRLVAERPLDVVFAGPTGSGKSTLVNSVSGLSASTAGVLRPTTSRPVIVADRAAADSYSRFGGVSGEVVAGDSPALRAMTLIDTPDLDSTSTEHRAMAERLIDSADVVVFVMSALRYADMVPWQVLRRADARGAIVVPVLNRVTPATAGARLDFRSRLREEGISERLIVIPEQRRLEGPIPRPASRPLARRLAGLVRDHRLDAAESVERVLRHVERRAESHLESLQVDVDGLQGTLGSDQIDAFDLSPLAAALPAAKPDGAGRRNLVRWRRQVQQMLTHRELVDRVTDALSAIVRTESMLAGLGAGSGLEVEPEMAQVSRAWLDFVARVCAEADGRRGEADVAYLARAAAADGGPIGDDPVFGSGFVVLTDRVERDLRGRLAMVIESALVSTLRADTDRLNGAIEETRTALAGLAPSPAPAHA